MSRHFKLVLFSTLFIGLSGNSFLAYANSNEKDLDDCGQALTSQGSATPAVEFRLTGVSPSRVRIMPVGRNVRPHQTRTGQVFSSVPGQKSLQIVVGEDENQIVSTWPFSTWDGLIPSWALDEKMESVLVAVNQERELHLFFPFASGRVPVMHALAKGIPQNAQVVRDRDGSILILVPSAAGDADIFAWKNEKLTPVAVGRLTSPYLFMGLGDRPWIAWSEVGPQSVSTLRAALFEGLSSPAFSWALEPGEQVSEFGYERQSENDGELIVVTNRRTLRFGNQSR